MIKRLVVFCSFTFAVLMPTTSQAVHSVAREWNEVLLQAIRKDFARPTVHARNLFHSSVAMYDAWAVYDQTAETFFLGRTVDGFECEFNGISVVGDVQAKQEETIAYAMYRLLNHRFASSPGAAVSLARFDSLLAAQGFDKNFVSSDYEVGPPAALGNYLAQKLIEFGLQDGANELGGYTNQFYLPVNDVLLPEFPGNPLMTDPNRWQPLGFDVFIDQSGNPFPGAVPPFLSPEWGQVTPFSLTPEDLTINPRGGFDYWVYHDPGAPAYLDTTTVGGISEEYKWGHSLVSIWSSHLDPTDGVMWDISPASIGNIPDYPTTIEGLRDFYDLFGGGETSQGWDVNPVTGEPYEPQIVPRGDYTRVLAEFWADGPASETPPGHWNTIANYVSDHPLVEKRFRGLGPVLSDLEWDVKLYLTLNGALHDVAVTAWGIKGWYDYVRPISAIRYMARLGQSSDSLQPNYHPGGIPLVPGYVEIVQPGDPLELADTTGTALGSIKVLAWRGPDYIDDPETDVAGVDWILAANWWPFQRPTFVTPPFAGYISGHSTFSRAAAEVMTAFTGSEYFPGGLGEFHAPQNEFLVFEEGPSVDLTLQWATYQDASDQCSLSRIWGGIHPPVDDIAGRHIGSVIGPEAFQRATELFAGATADAPDFADVRAKYEAAQNYPNPAHRNTTIEYRIPVTAEVEVAVHDIRGRRIATLSNETQTEGTYRAEWDGRDASGRDVAAGTYLYRVVAKESDSGQTFIRTGKMLLVQ